MKYIVEPSWDEEGRYDAGVMRCACGRGVELGRGDIDCACGRLFNAFGQELQHPALWAEDGDY